MISTWQIMTTETGEAHCSQQDWHSSHDCQNEERRYDDRSTLRIRFEDMVNFGELSVSQWLVVFRLGCIRIVFDMEIENMVAEGLRLSG